MWVILKETIKGPDYEILAINLETFNAISVINLDNKFQLVVMKYFDGHQSNQSNMHCLIEVFDTREQILSFFQEFVGALQDNKTIFDLRSRENSKDEKKPDKAYL